MPKNLKLVLDYDLKEYVLLDENQEPNPETQVLVGRCGLNGFMAMKTFILVDDHKFCYKAKVAFRQLAQVMVQNFDPSES